MKRWIKDGLLRVGLHGYTGDSLPTGVDWLHDIRRSGLLPEDPLCLDVGANIGQTVRELHAAWPAATIHAFEPFALPFWRLDALCRQLPGTVAVQQALGAAPALLQVAPHPQSVLSSLRSPAEDTSEPAERISVTTVDDYCDRLAIGPIGILKSDTEGFDLDVLRGASRRLAAQEIDFVHVEVTFDRHNTRNTPFAPVHDLLDGHGYRFLGLYETYPLHHFPEPNLFCNALFVSRRRWATGPWGRP